MNVSLEHTDGGLTRRQALQRAGLTVVSLGVAPSLLAACGGGESSAGIGGSVAFLSWEGYDLKGSKTMSAWKKANDVTFKSQYMANHDEIQAKLKGGKTQLDLITYYNGYANLYNTLDIIQPIDEAKVPNVKNCYPFFTTGTSYDTFWGIDGKRWAVPFTWGSAPCNYRADKIAAPTSWMEVFDEKYKGKVGTADDVGDFLLAGRLLGFTPPNYTQAQFKEVSDFMRKVVAQTNGVSAGYGDLANQLASGDVWLTFSGWAAMDVWAQAKGADVKSVLPEEGSFSFVDAYALPKTATNPDSSLAFMNEALTPQAQAEQALLLSAGTVNPDAVPLMDKATAALYPYEDLDALFAKAPLYLYPPVEANGEDVVTYEQWLAEWAKIKSGK